MGCHGEIFFDAPPVHSFLLQWPPVRRKSTKGIVEPGTLSAVEPYILKIFTTCTNVFCMLHGTYPCKGQENAVHTSRVERYVCVQITKMWFVHHTYCKEWPNDDMRMNQKPENQSFDCGYIWYQYGVPTYCMVCVFVCLGFVYHGLCYASLHYSETEN